MTVLKTIGLTEVILKVWIYTTIYFSVKCMPNSSEINSRYASALMGRSDDMLKSVADTPAFIILTGLAKAAKVAAQWSPFTWLLTALDWNVSDFLDNHLQRQSDSEISEFLGDVGEAKSKGIKNNADGTREMEFNQFTLTETKVGDDYKLEQTDKQSKATQLLRANSTLNLDIIMGKIDEVLDSTISISTIGAPQSFCAPPIVNAQISQTGKEGEIVREMTAGDTTFKESTDINQQTTITINNAFRSTVNDERFQSLEDIQFQAYMALCEKNPALEIPQFFAMIAALQNQESYAQYWANATQAELQKFSIVVHKLINTEINGNPKKITLGNFSFTETKEDSGSRIIITKTNGLMRGKSLTIENMSLRNFQGGAERHRAAIIASQNYVAAVKVIEPHRIANTKKPSSTAKPSAKEADRDQQFNPPTTPIKEPVKPLAGSGSEKTQEIKDPIFNAKFEAMILFGDTDIPDFSGSDTPVETPAQAWDRLMRKELSEIYILYAEIAEEKKLTGNFGKDLPLAVDYLKGHPTQLLLLETIFPSDLGENFLKGDAKFSSYTGFCEKRIRTHGTQPLLPIYADDSEMKATELRASLALKVLYKALENIRRRLSHSVTGAELKNIYAPGYQPLRNDSDPGPQIPALPLITELPAVNKRDSDNSGAWSIGTPTTSHDETSTEGDNATPDGFNAHNLVSYSAESDSEDSFSGIEETPIIDQQQSEQVSSDDESTNQQSNEETIKVSHGEQQPAQSSPKFETNENANTGEDDPSEGNETSIAQEQEDPEVLTLLPDGVEQQATINDLMSHELTHKPTVEQHLNLPTIKTDSGGVRQSLNLSPEDWNTLIHKVDLTPEDWTDLIKYQVINEIYKPGEDFNVDLERVDNKVRKIVVLKNLFEKFLRVKDLLGLTETEQSVKLFLSRLGSTEISNLKLEFQQLEYIGNCSTSLEAIYAKRGGALSRKYQELAVFSSILKIVLPQTELQAKPSVIQRSSTVVPPETTNTVKRRVNPFFGGGARR